MFQLSHHIQIQFFLLGFMCGTFRVAVGLPVLLGLSNLFSYGTGSLWPSCILNCLRSLRVCLETRLSFGMWSWPLIQLKKWTWGRVNWLRCHCRNHCCSTRYYGVGVAPSPRCLGNWKMVDGWASPTNSKHHARWLIWWSGSKVVNWCMVLQTLMMMMMMMMRRRRRRRRRRRQGSRSECDSEGPEVLFGSNGLFVVKLECPIDNAL